MKSLFLVLCLILLCWNPATAKDTIVVGNITSGGVPTQLTTSAYTSVAAANNYIKTIPSFINISNVCSSSRNPCHANASCTDVADSLVQCACKQGFVHVNNGTLFPVSGADATQRPGGTNCLAVDPCVDPGYDCGGITVGTCFGKAGVGYNCSCNPGYTVNNTIDPNVCQDINECAAPSHNCTTNATCVNAVGTFTCTCDPGFSGDGDTICSDVDECKSNSSCDSNANCTNTIGNFTCACKTGYIGDGKTCSASTLAYTFRAIFNITGGTGASGANEKTEILDIINEIKMTTTLIYDNATVDIETAISSGSDWWYIAVITLNGTNKNNDEFAALLDAHITTLPIGSGSVSSMSDYDECVVNYGNCSLNANCTNTNGSYICVCQSGYYDTASCTGGINGTNCVDPVNITCHLYGIEALVAHKYFEDISPKGVLVLGNCSGAISADGCYTEYNGSCATQISESADNKTLSLKWNLTNINASASVFTGYYIHRSIVCTLNKSQGAFQSFSAIMDIDGTQHTQHINKDLKLECSIYLDDKHTNLYAPTSKISTSDYLYFKCGSSKLPNGVKVRINTVKSSPDNGGPGVITSIEGGCEKTTTVLVKYDANSNGASSEGTFVLQSHYFRGSATTRVTVTVTLCSTTCTKTCPSGKRKRSIPAALRLPRQAEEQTLEGSWTFAVEEDDRCTRDCGKGLCVLDARNVSNCVCYDQTFKQNDGTCTSSPSLVEPAPARTTLWILIAMAVLLLVLIVAVVVAFVLAKKKSNQKEHELSHVNTHAIGN